MVCHPTATELHKHTDSKQICFYLLIKESDHSHNLVLALVCYAVILRLHSLTSNKHFRKAGSRCRWSSLAEISVTMELLDVKPLNDLQFHCVASGYISSLMLTGFSAILMWFKLFQRDIHRCALVFLFVLLTFEISDRWKYAIIKQNGHSDVSVHTLVLLNIMDIINK